MDGTEIGMIISGGLIGLTAAFPNRIYGYKGGTLFLNEDFKNLLLAAFLLLIVTLTLVIYITPIEMRWAYFLASVFCTGVLAVLLNRAVLEGRIFRQWTQPLKELYGVLPHRDSPHTPQPISLVQGLFEPEANDFSLSNALVCAHASWWAYKPESDINALSKDCNVRVRYLSNEHHAAIVLKIDNAIVLAFRGTDDMKDVIDDLRILPTSTAWGSVHRGFLSSVDTVWPLVKDALSELPKGDGSLWVTGHSLGAAMAVLVAMKITEDGNFPKVSGIYAFAQPRIGNVPYKQRSDKAFEGRHFRFETPRDEVPNQPPIFFSPGLLVYLSRKDEVWYNPNRLQKFLDQMQRETLGLLGEHSMLEYLRIIEHAQLNNPNEANTT